MRIRHLSVAAAVTLITPLFTFVTTQGPNATATATPVETSETQVALDSPQATAGDGDVVTAPDLALAKSQAVKAELSLKAKTAPSVLELSPEQAVPADLTVMGVSWAAGTAADTVVQYRARTAAGWGAWNGVDSEEGGAGSGDGSNAQARAGSDPVVVTGATHVQVRVLGSAGQDPVDARLTLIDPKKADADAHAGSLAPGSAAAAAAKPWINSRASWGADESIRRGSPSYAKVKGAVVHHTAGTNNYTQAQVPAILRGIYAFHVKDRGWNDVGYNFLVDKWGRVWEGRYGGTDRAVVGAHATGVNSETMGISVMGDYNSATVSNAAVDSVTRVIAWKAGVHGFNPNGRTTLFGRSFPTITGHRDVGQTSCPGTSLYSRLPAIRSKAAALAGGSASSGDAGSGSNSDSGSSGSGSSGSSTTPRATTTSTRGVATDNVLMRGSSGALFASAPSGNNLSFARRVSDTSWSGFNAVIAVGDVNRDGYGDVAARSTATGELRLFTGKRDGSLNASVRIGTGWRPMRSITGGADFTGDKVPDLMVIDRSGRLVLYRGNGRGAFVRGAVIGTGWANFSHAAAVGDWDGDGNGDVVGIRKDGKAFVFRGNGRGAFRGGAIALNGNYAGFTSVTGLVGRKAFVGVTSDGTGHYVRRTGASTAATTKVTPNFRGLTVFGG